MSLDLDDRQRAMLQEMGVHVWWPQADAPIVPVQQVAGVADVLMAPPPVPNAAPAPRRAAPVPPQIAIENIAAESISARAGANKSQESSAPAKNPATSSGLVEGIAAMDWATLADTVAQCQACKLCVGRRAPVFGPPQGAAGADAPRQADWLVLGEPPDEDEERAGTPFVGQVGQLLDNMLKAVGVQRQAPAGGPTADRRVSAYLSQVVKCRPASVRNPEPQELATCENYFKRELALVQPKVILAMGRFAAQTLLRDSLPGAAGLPLGKLRGRVYRYQGIPVVATYHPSYLLRTQQDKARAWADLCLALEQTTQAP